MGEFLGINGALTATSSNGGRKIPNVATIAPVVPWEQVAEKRSGSKHRARRPTPETHITTAGRMKHAPANQQAQPAMPSPSDVQHQLGRSGSGGSGYWRPVIERLGFRGPSGAHHDLPFQQRDVGGRTTKGRCPQLQEEPGNIPQCGRSVCHRRWPASRPADRGRDLWIVARVLRSR
jgi:hypothetical protein